MACLRKKGNRYYIKDYADGKEMWLRTGTDDPEVAKHKLEAYNVAKREGRKLFPTKTPLPDMLTAFCEHLEVVSRPENYTKDLSRLRNIFGRACPELGGSDVEGDSDFCTGDCLAIRVKHLEDITTCHVTDLQTKLAKERGLSGKTINNYREMLMRFVNWAITQKGKRFPGGINPIVAVKVRDEQELPISYLEGDDIVQQLDVLKEFDVLQVMVAILIFAGLRREEILWLRTGDIVERGGVLRILVRTKLVDGKKWRPKNKKDRYVPVSPTLRPYVEKVWRVGMEDRWLFPSPTGMRWNPDNFSQLLRDTNLRMARRLEEENQSLEPGEKAKKPMPIWSCLDYRHTFGTMLASNGVSLYIIAAWMGNSPEVCRKHYAHLIPDLIGHYAEFMVPMGAMPDNTLSAVESDAEVPDLSIPLAVQDPAAEGGERKQSHLRLVVNNRW